ncbi:hypothetical protein EVAR_97896_1 [Eumeta japonica]|uniref:Uncharacterized protein n=1 Tax=Eumeta variegata TaxID=151549 RepID=A0A4C1WGX0_EUMVA|nr:hypothetical protein EVAR_97896_1 [Eumeta japonica]
MEDDSSAWRSPRRPLIAMESNKAFVSRSPLSMLACRPDARNNDGRGRRRRFIAPCLSNKHFFSCVADAEGDASAPRRSGRRGSCLRTRALVVRE